MKSANREYAPSANRDAEILNLLNQIADPTTTSNQYRQAMVSIGEKLGSELANQINIKSDRDDIVVVCTVEDADFLAKGVLNSLAKFGFGNRVKLMCLWNTKFKSNGVNLTPILRQYLESESSSVSTIIVVKSIIASACVVKTNLTRAISTMMPEEIFIVAPVFMCGAEQRLASEFSATTSKLFRYVWYAIDPQTEDEFVIPGIGGSVYERLGLGDEVEKINESPRL
jgi:hypothetical protein